MRGAMLRKMTVLNRIEGLPDDKRDRVKSVYTLYDRLEFLKVMPVYVFLMFGILAPFYGYAQAAPPEFGPYGKFLIAGLTTAIWALGFVLSQRLFFGPKRKRIKTLILSEIGGSDDPEGVLETLRRLDPDMVRNCGPLE